MLHYYLVPDLLGTKFEKCVNYLVTYTDTINTLKYIQY